MDEALWDLKAMAEEDLDPELVDWIEETGPFGPSLKHPLVYQVPYTLPGLANRALAAKRRALTQAIEAEDWHSVIFLHERPYRTEALVEHVIGLDDDWAPTPLARCTREQQGLAATVWVDSENLHQVTELWTAMFSVRVPGKLLLGNKEERAEFNALPDPVTVYRGDIDDGGWSWSTNENVARFFANRFGGSAPILTAEVPKSTVFAYLTRRNEFEILCDQEAPIIINKSE